MNQFSCMATFAMILSLSSIHAEDSSAIPANHARPYEPAVSDAGITVEHRLMPRHWGWPLEGPIALKVPTQAFNWKPTDAQALPEKPETGTAPELIRLVPSGCTKFRISMFPVTPRAWPR